MRIKVNSPSLQITIGKLIQQLKELQSQLQEHEFDEHGFKLEAAVGSIGSTRHVDQMLKRAAIANCLAPYLIDEQIAKILGIHRTSVMYYREKNAEYYQYPEYKPLIDKYEKIVEKYIVVES